MNGEGDCEEVSETDIHVYIAHIMAMDTSDSKIFSTGILEKIVCS